jgi:hypothetical protein
MGCERALRRRHGYCTCYLACFLRLYSSLEVYQTTAALTTFVLAMVLNPDVQRKAQEEIDTIVGHGRLPSLDDRPRMPYMEALLLEVLRYHPIGPMGMSIVLSFLRYAALILRVGIPHAVSQDDYYNGMFIPKESIVLVNLWCVVSS